MENVMKTELYAVVGLLFILSAISCQKELVEPDGETPVVSGVTFSAVAEHSTKTSIQDDDPNASDYGKVSWTAGDRMKFVYETHEEGSADKTVGYPESSPLTAEDIVDGIASVTVNVPEDIRTKVAAGLAHLYAVYPSCIDVDYDDGSSFKMTVPAVQDGTFASASIALAKLDKTNVDAALEFKNFCGLFRITVTDDSIRKLVVSSNSDIAGKVNVTFAASGPAVKNTVDVVKEITVNIAAAGTYYVAVLPGELDGVTVNAYNASDILVGDASTSATILLERAHIRSMGTMGASSYYFVKPEGSGDGSSWDNAADLKGLTAILNTDVSKKVYMAEGTYTESSELKIQTGNPSFDIRGGYPADAAGFDVATKGSGETVIDCNGLRGIVATKGAVKIDGITFKNAARTDDKTPGSVIVIQGADTFVADNCKFIDNRHSSKGTLLGVIRLASTNAEFRNCVFSGNEATSTSLDTKHGSVFYQYGTASLTLDGCEFYGNKASSYGTVLYTIGKTDIRNCVFGKTDASNVSTSRGGAICVDAESEVSISGSEFTSNSGAIGGAIYVNKVIKSLEISNTLFSGNIATNASYGGGAIAISGDSKLYEGIIEIRNCKFDGNTAAACGGAIWANGAGVAFTDCNFTSNKVTATVDSENGLGGGAVYSAASAATRIFFNRCFFANNSVPAAKWGHHVDINSETALFAMNNCVIRAPWAVTIAGDKTYKGVGSIITSKAFSAVVNTTIYTQTGNPQITLGSKEKGGAAYVNDIIINGAGTPDNFSNPDDTKYVDVYYSLYNQVREASSKNVKFTGCVGNLPNKPNADNSNGALWGHQSNGSVSKVDDVRGQFYYYPWSGSYEGFTKADLASVRAAVEAVPNVGPAFLSWLGADIELSRDICGNARDVNAMWPGSYEGSSSSAGMENFNVK